MNVNNEGIYQFAIQGGVLELSFEEEGVLQLVVRAAGESDAETGSNIVTKPADHVTVLVEESVVSLSAFSLRVIVWKYPLSVQVLTESGDWLFRVEAIQIGPGEESVQTFRRSPTIRITAERSEDDVIEVDVAHQKWLLHRREKSLYGIKLPQGERGSIDATLHADSYSVTTDDHTLRLSMLYGSAVAGLKRE